MSKYTRIMIAPGRYVQGRGAINEIGDHIEFLGKTVLVVGGKTGLEATRNGRTESFATKHITQYEEVFNRECTFAEVDRLIAVAKHHKCDVILASGGGKTIDTVKIVADKIGAATVVCPTIASSDAPCSRLSVVYDEHGEFVDFYFPKRSPDVVLVDSSIIANGPVRFLAAGMGDALATWFEADACARSCALNLTGGQAPSTALACARLCFDILMESGVQAKIACENKLVTPALDAVIEANVLLSGLGFESGGLGAAHSMQDGFTVLKEIHHFYHGEKVAFLTLTQLVMENRPKQMIEQVYEFCYKVGLPITLADLGIDKVGPKRLMEAVKLSCLPGKIMYNHAFPITEDMVYDAMLAADSMGKLVKAGKPIIQEHSYSAAVAV